MIFRVNLDLEAHSDSDLKAERANTAANAQEVRIATGMDSDQYAY